jgi:hypothetical protein
MGTSNHFAQRFHLLHPNFGFEAARIKLGIRSVDYCTMISSKVEWNSFGDPGGKG